MNEIRIDNITGKQVIIATNRRSRPIDNKNIQQKQVNSKLQYSHSECPFCKGNEAETPCEILKIGDENWSVRVVKNKYPTVTEDGDTIRGYHYVVIETPNHNKKLYKYKAEKWRDIFTAYKDAAYKCFRDKDIRYLQIFKNYGRQGGASLEHPHSQIVALNFTPQSKLMEDKYCKVCEEVESELIEVERIVLDRGNYIVYAPYGSTLQYQLRIALKHHRGSFEEILSEDGIDELSKLFEEVFKIIYESLGDIPLNICYYIYKDGNCYQHFYVDILPRGSFFAGFEMSTEVYINVISPEEAANKFREVTGYVQVSKVEL
ncbi:galactose-1-phosphate uridylyltransferase [Clostridium fungisolvens]|uniref:Galactose-1-phosphate uridylyltransferase n=1 Tax=Clostridium fungisolvens TaxID=1604897 RepID=A0A6V8SGN8_9CLOT|nr:DUF4931 domain-containing protein [Clostridium fungisolvens]GFP74043.1 Galactose-1-phosphate uridylyltransferase [Clostridium fungisolvens]